MLNAILPVLLIILLGVAIRRYGWLPEAFSRR
jgi:predicted permease